MLSVGLTGGIGAGKSAAAHELRSRGAVIVDSDVLARAAVEPGSDGLDEVVAEFGTGILDENGALDRRRLGAIVFADHRARARLNGIVHPRVRAAAAQLTEAAPADAVVVHDIPLLVETGQGAAHQLVLVVDAPEALRIERLRRTRGMTEDEVRARMAAQATEAERLAAADVVLRNDGTRGELATLVGALWRDRLVPFERNLRTGRTAAPPAIGPLDTVAAGHAADTVAAGHAADTAAETVAAASRLAARIRRAGEGRITRIDLIGPASVVGIGVDPVLVLQAVAESSLLADLAAALPGIGFPSIDPEAAARWAERLHASADPGSPALVVLWSAGDTGWRRALMVRDWWRTGHGAAGDRVPGPVPDRRSWQECYRVRRDWGSEHAAAAQQWATRTGGGRTGGDVGGWQPHDDGL